MKTTKDFDEAEKFFKSEHFTESFISFESIAEDASRTREERAEAFNMLGVIVSAIDSHLAPDDYNGLGFYRQALTMNPHSLGTLLNIVSSFGNKSPSMHLDKELFLYAYDTLTKKLNHLLTDFDKEEINERYKLYEKLNETNLPEV